MKIKRSLSEKKDMGLVHRRERDARVCDRIKAALLRSKDWTYRQIAQSLQVHKETVRTHLEGWQREKKLKSSNGSSENHLNCEQTQSLIAHLKQTTYTCVANVFSWILTYWKVNYTVSDMTKWFHAHDFS